MTYVALEQRPFCLGYRYHNGFLVGLLFGEFVAPTGSSKVITGGLHLYLVLLQIPFQVAALP